MRKIVVEVPDKNCVECKSLTNWAHCGIFGYLLSVKFSNKTHKVVKVYPCKECLKATIKKALPQVNHVDKGSL